jgi:hypothetical protein
MTDQPDFKVGDVVLERTDGGYLDARTLGSVVKVFGDTLSIKLKNARYAKVFDEGKYYCPKNKAVLANSKLIYHLWELESKKYGEKTPMYFEETKK